jgi:hypothetical protein
MKATPIKELDWQGIATLYRCDPPFREAQVWDEEEDTPRNCEYIVVSAVTVPWTGPETLIFESDSEGNVTNWSELKGYRGTLDHHEVLRPYVIQENPNDQELG